jgi:P4 family phage/plasmid primase-like protien
MGKEKRDATKSAIEKLYSFMDIYRNKANKGTKLPYTHTCIYSPFGSYNIPESVYLEFIKLYENAILDGARPHIAESHKEYGPIVIDFDFVSQKKRRAYTNVTIMNIIKLYNRVINKYLDVSETKMDAYVMEKKNPDFRKNEYHDGLHIVYPNICTKPSLQLVMRSVFLESATETKIFDRMKLSNSLDQVFDKSVIHKGHWLLYGSVKNPTNSMYDVTHIYGANCKSDGDKKKCSIFETLIQSDTKTPDTIRHYVNALSCRRFDSSEQMTPLNSKMTPEIVDDQINRIVNKLTKDCNIPSNKIHEIIGNDYKIIRATNEEELVEVRNLVNFLSAERASHYKDWYQVGKCLFNIDYRLLDDWIAFSKKTKRKNFIVGECEALWKKMRHSNYTISTIHYYASKDNPTMYTELQKSRITEMMKRCLNDSNHFSVANVSIEKYKYRFKCASIKHSTWYEFHNHRWIETDSAYSLRLLISRDLYKDVIAYQAVLYGQAGEKEGRKRENKLEDAARIGKLIKSLGDNNFKNGVIKESSAISYDRDFLRRLDENVNLLCFTNGVYDLELDIFREGCPDDNISLCTGYDYVPYKKNDTIIKEISSFLSKIQTDEVMREYTIKLLSTCLSGSIKEESFYVFTGSGANGKSKLMELMKYTMGEYFKPMDVRLITEKRGGSSGATPEVADKKGIRICPFDEPGKSDKVNTGFMKLFTGGDEIPARALFKEPVYFKPQFKPFLLCNDLPQIESDDDGTWRRIKVIPFGSKFIKKSEATKKNIKDVNNPDNNIFWADTDISSKLSEWKQGFMWLLIKYHKLYREEGLIHPPLVTKETDLYRAKCDIFQDFINDYLEKTDKQHHVMSIIELHDGMRTWHKNNYDGKCSNTKELREYIKQRMANMFDERKDVLKGYRVKKDDNVDGEMST